MKRTKLTATALEECAVFKSAQSLTELQTILCARVCSQTMTNDDYLFFKFEVNNLFTLSLIYKNCCSSDADLNIRCVKKDQILNFTNVSLLWH